MTKLSIEVMPMTSPATPSAQDIEAARKLCGKLFDDAVCRDQSCPCCVTLAAALATARAEGGKDALEKLSVWTGYPTIAEAEQRGREEERRASAMAATCAYCYHALKCDCPQAKAEELVSLILEEPKSE